MTIETFLLGVFVVFCGCVGLTMATLYVVWEAVRAPRVRMAIARAMVPHGYVVVHVARLRERQRPAPKVEMPPPPPAPPVAQGGKRRPRTIRQDTQPGLEPRVPPSPSAAPRRDPAPARVRLEAQPTWESHPPVVLTEVADDPATQLTHLMDMPHDPDTVIGVMSQDSEPVLSDPSRPATRAGTLRLIDRIRAAARDRNGY